MVCARNQSIRDANGHVALSVASSKIATRKSKDREPVLQRDQTHSDATSVMVLGTQLNHISDLGREIFLSLTPGIVVACRAEVPSYPGFEENRAELLAIGCSQNLRLCRLRRAPSSSWNSVSGCRRSCRHRPGGLPPRVVSATDHDHDDHAEPGNIAARAGCDYKEKSRTN